MKKIRVMQIVNSLAIGGAERVAVNIAAHLDPTRFESVILAIEGLGPLVAVLDALEISCIPLNKKSGKRPSVFLGIAKEVIRRHVDILTTHNYAPLLYGSIGGRIAGCKRLLHVDHARRFPSRKRWLISEKYLTMMAYKVIAVSEELREDLVKYEGMRKDRIDIILNGIDEVQFQRSLDVEAKKRELCIPLDKLVIGLGVRLAEEKGVTFLLDAARLLKRRRTDILFVIAGDGPLRNELQTKATAIGLKDFVRFIGERMDLNEVLQALDVYVLPSISEGLPLSLLEAMAAKRAIVATEVGGIPSLIQNGKSGLLVPAKDPQKLADAIGRLLDDRVRRHEFGVEAFRVFIKRYSARMMADSYAAYYSKMMERRPFI